jgi:hypothetical protein
MSRDECCMSSNVICTNIELHPRKPKDKKCNAVTVFRAVDTSQSVYTNGIVISRTYNRGCGVKISLCLQKEDCVYCKDVVVMTSGEKKGCRKFKKL